MRTDLRCINTLLDQDLYKLTMMQAVLHMFPAAMVKYKFRCRNIEQLGKIVTPDMVWRDIKHLCSLKFESDELSYLSSLKFFKPDFIDFLRIFSLNENFIQISTDRKHNLCIDISGPWLHTIMFEVFVLAIVNELYGREMNSLSGKALPFKGEGALKKKVNFLKKSPLGFKVIEFGTRRRHSLDWQECVYKDLAKTNRMVGTSNVLLARLTKTTPCGTMAHEWLQAGQALGPRLRDSQTFMLDAWVKEYRGDLGIALTDVIGIDAFLKDFDLYFAKVYDGVRHDSGCPFEFGEKIIKKYESFKIDPRTKTAVFSDSLDLKTAMRIYRRFAGRINVVFGIGTFLTNDVGYRVPNIVIKMTECNGEPVAKISDSPGKSMCQDAQYVRYLAKVFGR